MEEQFLHIEPVILDDDDLSSGSHGQTYISDEELAKIRDKTFTPELKELVNKITSHKPGDDPELSPELDSITEDEMMRKLHRLFYNCLNLTGAGTVNTCFDAFAVDEEAVQKNYYKKLSLQILVHAGAVKMESLCILSFSFKNRCYQSFFHNIPDIEKENLAIDINERLYQEITKSERGVLLTGEHINDDIYLKKRFQSLDNGKYRLYFLSFLRLYNELQMDFSPGGSCLISMNRFLPILMVKISQGEYTIDDIYSRVKNHLIFPLILYMKNRVKVHNEYYFTRLDLLYEIMENYFYLFIQNSGSTIYSINLKEPDNNLNYYIMKYLLLKLNKALALDTTIFHISKDRIIIFSMMSQNEAISSIINDFNPGEELLVFKKVNFTRMSTFINFLKEYIIS